MTPAVAADGRSTGRGVIRWTAQARSTGPTTTSSSAAAPPAACSPTASARTRGRRVLLLEAGGRDSYPWIHIPVGYLYCMGNPRTDWMMRTEAEPGLNGRSLAYPRGKVLGGCTAINGMIYMRGQAADYDHWRQLGNAGWGWDDVLPYFLQIRGQLPRRDRRCTAAAANGRSRGSGCAGTSSRRSATPPRRSASPAATTSTTATTRARATSRSTSANGIRWTAAKAFLRPALQRPNLRVRDRRARHRARRSTAGGPAGVRYRAGRRGAGRHGRRAR